MAERFSFRPCNTAVWEVLLCFVRRTASLQRSLPDPRSFLPGPDVGGNGGAGNMLIPTKRRYVASHGTLGNQLLEGLARQCRRTVAAGLQRV